MSTLEAEPRTMRLDAASRQRLLDSVSVQVPERELASGYKVGMIFLAVAMIGLAGAFAALIGFLAWLGVWHLYNALVSLSAGPYFLFHVPMALLGLTLVLFLIKPIFLRTKGGEHQVMELAREKEPLLYEYVERLCRSVGAPVPDVIRVDCVPNASAAIELKWLGLRGRKCMVQIGLPLAAGMSVSQLTGILGHELGHLTQRGGMVASQLVRRMTCFFGQVVFQRDRLDVLLYRLRSNRNGLGRLLYWVAVVFIEPARGVLWLMMLLGESLSTHFLRRMEFDADWLEAQIYGVGEFEKVSQDLLFLGIAADRAHRRMADSWEQRRLADDYPRLIVSEAKFLRTHHKELIEFLENQKTRWFDTHPCHSDRVLNVRDLNLEASPPLVQLDVPAAALFSDFDDLCHRATHHMYQRILKEDVSKAAYVPTAQMTAEFERREKRFKVLDEFFAGQPGVDGPIFPEASAGNAPASVPEAIAALQRAREGVEQAAPGIGKSAEGLQESTMRLNVAMAQQDLANLFPNNAQASALFRRARRSATQQTQLQADCRRHTNAFAAAAGERFTLALQLAAHPVVTGRMRHGAAAQKLLARYLPLALALRKFYPQVQTLMQQAMAVRILCSSHSHEQPYRPLVDRILTVTDFLLKSTQKLRQEMDAFTYPFEHAVAGITVGKALNEEMLPRSNDPAAVHAYVVTCIDRFHVLAYRVLSQLATVGAAAESALNFKPLVAPPVDRKLEGRKRDRSGLKEWLAYSGRAAAGLLLLGTLTWWSFDPPALPNLAWGGSSGSYRPAAFSPSVEHFNRYDPSAYAPASPPRVAMGGSGAGSPEAPGLQMPGWGQAVQAPKGAPQFTPRGAPPQMAVPAIPIPGRAVSPYTPYQPGRSNVPGTPGYPNVPGSPGYTGSPGVRQPGTPYTPPTYTPPTYTPPTMGRSNPPTYTPPTPRGYTPPTPPTYTPPRAPTGGGFAPGGGVPSGRGG